MTRPFLALPLLLAATTPPGPRPGLYAVTSVPTGATLDGRTLGDLPDAGTAAPATLCLPADRAGDATALARDVPDGCVFTHASLAGGRIDVRTTCPAQSPWLAKGTVTITGRWTPTGYGLRFATLNPSGNGVMTSTGGTTAHRVGDCPSVSLPPLPAPRP